MKLATKLIAVFVVVMLGALTIDGYVAIHSATALFKTNLKRDVAQLRDAIVASHTSGGHVEVLQLIEQVNSTSRRIRVRWVRLDAEPGSPEQPKADVTMAQVTHSEEGIFFAEGHPIQRSAMLVYAHVPIGQEHPGVLEINAVTEEMDQFKAAITVHAIRVAAVIVFVTGVLAVVLGSRMVGRPLQRLIAKTRRISEGELGDPLVLRGHDELSALASSINDMCDQLAESRERARRETAKRVEAMKQLRHADRLRTVGRLAAGIAHELGTPLNVVSGRADLISRQKLTPKAAAENALIIKEQSDRMAKTIRHMLDFARRTTPERSRTDLRGVVRKTVGLLRALARKQQVELSFIEQSDPAWLEIDSGQIQQVLTNLILNSIQATSEGGQVCIRIESTRTAPPEGPEAKDRTYFRLDVEDTGTGIAEEHLDQLFDPFFTTKGIGEGTGMGLSIAYGIVHEHGGWITAASQVGKGSVFSVFLPAEEVACPTES